jgi:hypothetical protein
MQKIKYLTIVMAVLILLPNAVMTQDKDLAEFFKNFKISSYADVYYAYDNDKNIDKDPRLLDLISPYRDQIRLNIASLTLKYGTDNIRSTFTIHYGDIPELNWKPVTKYDMIQEANIGFSPQKNLWIDAGYFVTHIGAEGLPKNNVLSSFSLPVYVEPFIQSGVKVGYDFSDKFTACFHLLNGYNVFEDNNKNKSFGVQLAYTVNDKLKFTYNNLIGNEMPAGVDGRTRFFNNFIVNVSPCKKIDMIASADICTQEQSSRTNPDKSAYTYGAFLSTRYKFNPKFSATVRGEYYQDIDGILSGAIGSYNWLKGNGITIGCEYRPVESAYLRAETRYIRLDSDLKPFYKNNERTEAMLSFGFEY